jgi:hypothetical protein
MIPNISQAVCGEVFWVVENGETDFEVRVILVKSPIPALMMGGENSTLGD